MKGGARGCSCIHESTGTTGAKRTTPIDRIPGQNYGPKVNDIRACTRRLRGERAQARLALRKAKTDRSAASELEKALQSVSAPSVKPIRRTNQGATLSNLRRNGRDDEAEGLN
jgi:hypothetical protein